jgi:hypothetical protein
LHFEEVIAILYTKRLTLKPIRTLQTSNTHVNKAIHNTQFLNSQCQEEITRNNKEGLTEYHYNTGTTTVAPGYVLTSTIRTTDKSTNNITT